MSELLSGELGNGGKPKRARQHKSKKGCYSAQGASTEGASTQGASTEGASTHVHKNMLQYMKYLSSELGTEQFLSKQFRITHWNQFSYQTLNCIAVLIEDVFTRHKKIPKSYLFQQICHLLMSVFRCQKIIFDIHDEWPRGDLFIFLTSIGLLSSLPDGKYCYPSLLFSLFPVERNVYATEFLNECIKFSRISGSLAQAPDSAGNHAQAPDLWRTYSISDINPVLPPQIWDVPLTEIENFTKTVGPTKDSF